MSTPPQRPPARKRVVLLALCLAAYIISLDVTIVNVALPSLVRQACARQPRNCNGWSTLTAWSSPPLFWSPEACPTGGAARERCSSGSACSPGPAWRALTTTTGELTGARAAMGLGAAMISRPPCRC